jgi:hypothetical protein
MRTITKNNATSHHGSDKSGKPTTDKGNNIHSSAQMRPSSLMPSIFSAASQTGIAANVNAVQSAI